MSYSELLRTIIEAARQREARRREERRLHSQRRRAASRVTP
jgi:hypothetical protein